MNNYDKSCICVTGDVIRISEPTTIHILAIRDGKAILRIQSPKGECEHIDKQARKNLDKAARNIATQQRTKDSLRSPE